MEQIFVNSRVLLLQSNGQKRVAEELIRRIPGLSLAKPRTFLPTQRRKTYALPT